MTQISLGVGKNQKWKVDGVDGVFFRITRFGATNSLTVRENEPDQPASKPSAVQEAPFAGAPKQLWAFTPVPDTMGGWTRQDIGKQPSIGRTERVPAAE